jgi:uracil phosphoribosyltransferase
MQNVDVLSHPLIQHKLTLLRQKATPPSLFRSLLQDISAWMAYELSRQAPVLAVDIETPLEGMRGMRFDGQSLALVSILRAGNGMLEGMLRTLPEARVGHIGLYRDPETLQAVEYYFKMPHRTEDLDVVVADPMLATGHTAVAALQRIAALRPRSLRLACLVACPEGLRTLQKDFPQVPVMTCAIDRELNEHGYILPGLGDAGDRMFATF